MVYTCLKGPDWTTPVLGDQDGLHLCQGTRMVYVLGDQDGLPRMVYVLGDQDGLPMCQGTSLVYTCVGVYVELPLSQWFRLVYPCLKGLGWSPCVKGLG